MPKAEVFYQISSGPFCGLGCLLPTLRAKSLARLSPAWSHGQDVRCTVSAHLSPSLDFHHPSIPFLFWKIFCPISWPKLMRVQMKMCPWLVGRGSFIITSSKLSCFSFNNTDCYKWSASWNRSPTHKTTTISILIYFYPIICSSHIFKNRAMVTYVQVCLILCHTFYTYFLVLNISPYCNIVGCTNF